MNCEEYRAMISCAIDGECTESEKAELDAHLAGCEECRNYAKFLKEISDKLKTDLDAPPELKMRVMKSVREEARRKKVHRLTRYGSLAACAVLAVSLGLYAERSFKSNEGMESITMVSGAKSDMVMEESSEECETFIMMEADEIPAEIAECDAGAGNTFFMAGAESSMIETAAPVPAPFPDAETLAREFLREYYGSDFDECTLEFWETAEGYTPLMEDYLPEGEITAVMFDSVTVLLDENMNIFGIIE